MKVNVRQTDTGKYFLPLVVIMQVREAIFKYSKYDFYCYTVHVVELLNYYANHRTYKKFYTLKR